MDRKKVIKKLQDAEISLRGFANHFPPLRDECHEQADACYDAIELLQSQPQIVRCKDCDYWSDAGILTECSRFNGMLSTDEYFFCAYGKPKGGDGE